MPALDFYMHIVAMADEYVDANQSGLIQDPEVFFNHVAVKYPLGLIREQNGQKRFIDRTPISVGADKSLQFSAQIPVGTKASILYLPGDIDHARCRHLTHAVKLAFQEGKKKFPAHITRKQVLIMDCVGRKKTVEFMGEDYNDIEFKQIARELTDSSDSPFGPLTYGEMSSMDGQYVELHNKTAVVGIIEDN